MILSGIVPVSYTHLDVYKRQVYSTGNESLERLNIKLVQTPQAFLSSILLPAFNIDYKEKFTDEASVVEAFGMKVPVSYTHLDVYKRQTMHCGSGTYGP